MTSTNLDANLSKIESLSPSRLDLAHTPTPLQPMPRLSEKLGIELLVKRDDLTGAELSGNKIRKLEFVLAEALEQGADTVLTCGGIQSNHCRATAAAAARLGLSSVLLLRVPDPSSPPAWEANSLLDRLVGSEIVWVTPEEYARRGERFEIEAEKLRRAGKKPYIIPEGASNALGSWGYLRAMTELARDLSRLEDPGPGETTVIYAAGSGGTGAGLILGNKLLELGLKVAGVNVGADEAYFVNAIGEICEEAIERFGLGLTFSRDRDIKIIDGYVGRGYALSRPEELELIRDVARTEGWVLDPVYTGKAFYGLNSQLAENPGIFGKRVVFIHTGGLFGLFPKAGEFSDLL